MSSSISARPATRSHPSPIMSDNAILDPRLHSAGPSNPSPPSAHYTLGSLTDPTNTQDPLTDFARQVIESEHPLTGDDDDAELFHPEEGIEAAVRAAEALDAEAEAEAERAGMLNDFEKEEVDELHEAEAEGAGSGEGEGSTGRPSGARAGKRKRKDQNGGLVAEESRDLARMKKDSHKEVERKRRDQISEGITQIGALIPNVSEKMGKGQILKLAAQYLAEVSEKVNEVDTERARRDAETQKLQNDLDQVQVQLTAEHNRSLTLETSWREAEDRAAASQFELERVKKELDDTKMRLLEIRR